ncbi:DUF2927 domain-containing protein [Celeribacter sp.]|uniref:DUF2927 domain-containing protein n=1 Tax=Celeribacter sp. TaxID=1890673 RepID=UPI003A8DCB9E
MGRIAGAAALASTLVLSACVDPMTTAQTAAPSQTPAAKPSAPIVAPRSPASAQAVRYYADVQADLLRNELLRTDGGGADTPFNARQLAENFDAIALNDEYADINGSFVARTTPSHVHRWSAPVRLTLEFGASVPLDQRAEDRETLTSLARQLATATRHPITVAETGGNFHVLVLNEDERRGVGTHLRRLIPGLSEAAVRSVENMSRSTYCLVIASDPRDDGIYRRAVAVIRGEHPSLMRKSCFHEEIAQGLGLANDSPRARPSIFNDDEEFALLTRHDELLLRILYDPRLTPNMTPETARPIAATIAAELMGETI